MHCLDGWQEGIGVGHFTALDSSTFTFDGSREHMCTLPWSVRSAGTCNETSQELVNAQEDVNDQKADQMFGHSHNKDILHMGVALAPSRHS